MVSGLFSQWGELVAHFSAAEFVHYMGVLSFDAFLDCPRLIIDWRNVHFFWRPDLSF